MKKKKVNLDINKVKIRKDWGKVKPFTRVEKDKTKYVRKEKHPDKSNDSDNTHFP